MKTCPPVKRDVSDRPCSANQGLRIDHLHRDVEDNFTLERRGTEPVKRTALASDCTAMTCVTAGITGKVLLYPREGEHNKTNVNYEEKAKNGT